MDKLIVAVNRKCKISTWQHTQVQRSAQTILQFGDVDNFLLNVRREQNAHPFVQLQALFQICSRQEDFNFEE